MFRTLIFKGVKVLTKIVKYVLRQTRYLLSGLLYETALLFDMNYNFIKRIFMAKSECTQEFIIYVMLALSIYAINDLLPKKEISNLSTNLKKVVIKANALTKDKTNKKEVKQEIELVEIEPEEVEEKIEVIEVDDVEKVDTTFNGCNMDYTSCKIKEVAISYKIDWKLSIAIARHECGYKNGEYLSNAYKEKNNVGGMMYYDPSTKSSKLMRFETIDSGINAYVSNLKRNYFDLGLDTIAKIQPKYAPVGAANDPYGLNNVWQIGVKSYLSQLY